MGEVKGEEGRSEDGVRKGREERRKLAMEARDRPHKLLVWM